MRLTSITGSEVRTYTVSLKRKTLRSTRKLFLSSASDTARNLSGGMPPRSFQLLTALGPIPSKFAAAVVPPSASTTASTDVSMPHINSHAVKMSIVHGAPVDISQNVRFNNVMDTWPVIARRLDLFAKAVWQLDHRSAASICDGICDANGFSQLRKGVDSAGGERRLSPEVAAALSDRFEKYGLTLDWWFRGRESRNFDIDLRSKMEEIAINEERGIPAPAPKRGPKPKKIAKVRAARQKIIHKL